MTTAPQPIELSALTREEWHSLRVYQDLYQLLLTLIHDERAHDLSSSEEGEPLHLDDSALRSRALERLSGPPKQLLKLTFEELIQQLIDARWIKRVDERLSLSYSFERRISRLLDGLDPFEVAQKTSAKRSAEAPRRSEPELEYVDLFAHVSEEDDTLLTARHLEQVVAALDGLTLLVDGLYELISFSDDPRFPALLSTMERATLLKREGQYIKLELQGAQIAREERAERLKLLGVIAERMRRDVQRGRG